ncbi:MAG: extracellular solute-binding protein [Telluria sp.]
MWKKTSYDVRVVCKIAAVFLIGLSGSAFAQTKDKQHDIYTYEGADREQRLLEGARKEGPLTIYTSMVDRDMRQITEAFQKKYGLKTTFWRGSAQKVLQRTVTETRGGRNEVDVLQAPGLVMEALHQEKLLQAVRSPYTRDLSPRAFQPHGEWVAIRAYVYVQAYNTQLVSKEELPRTFSDLLDPKWKGRLGVEAKAQEWFRTLVHAMGDEKGLNLFREIVAKNGVSVRSGNSLLNNLVVSGEVPFALSVYSYLPEKARVKGAPIDYIALQPTIAYSDGIGVAQKAKNPHAAMLFFDFMLNEGLVIVKGQQQLTMHKRDEAALERFKPTFIDPARMLIDYDKGTQFYEDTVAGRPTDGAAK